VVTQKKINEAVICQPLGYAHIHFFQLTIRVIYYPLNAAVYIPNTAHDRSFQFIMYP
jgi:hypothetical protein